MEKIDYQKLGFKCGLEIHQQLEGRKLFCSCPTINSSEEADVKFQRRLRAVAGETGEVDIAAKHEMEKGRKFEYEADSRDTCLVELDEEPPHSVNQAALDTSIKIALLLNANIVDEIQFMRKIVVDGSNVSGFQRTALIATDGFVVLDKGTPNELTIKIPTICLEEEAARKIEETKDSVSYRLDRLGIPLIEIATSADIKNAEDARWVAQKIGDKLRSFEEEIKRGLGTIRQDVNISISQGARTEIKGFQELRSIPKVIDFEVNRQHKLINVNKKLNNEVRKAEFDKKSGFSTTFLRPMPGAARLYPETDVLPIVITKDYIRQLQNNLPEDLSKRIEDIKKRTIGEDLARELAYNKKFFNIFNRLIGGSTRLSPATIAYSLINDPKEIKKREKKDITKMPDIVFETVVMAMDEGKINVEGAFQTYLELDKFKITSDTPEKEIKSVLKKIMDKFKITSVDTLEKEIKELIEKKKGLSIGAYMGIIMGKYRGKVDGKKIMEILRKYVK